MSFHLRVILLALIVFAVSARAEEPKFVEVSDGDLAMLKKNVPEAFRGDLNYEEVDELIRQLVLTGNYERVLARDGADGQIEVVGKALRLVKDLSFNGNSSVSSRDLKEAAQLRIGEKFDRRKIIKAGEAIKQLYADRGFYNAIIEVSFIRMSDNNLNISFNINEKAPCRVEKVEVRSPNQNLNERLEYTVRGYRKDPLTSNTVDKIAKDISEFLLERRYLHTEFGVPTLNYNEDKTKATVIFELRDPSRYEVYFQGPDGRRRQNESELYSASLLDEYERPSEDPASEVTDRIRRFYLGQGYPNVRVEAKSTDIVGEFVRRVYITVDEGPRVKISEIDVQGRLSRPPQYYAEFIRKNSSDLIKRGYYNREDLELGYKNLITDLRNQGYLRSKIQSSRIEYSKDKNLAKVLIILDEGPLTQIRAIRFEGTSAFTQAQLLEAMNLQSQAPLRLNALENALASLKQLYQSHGYLEMKLLNESESFIEYNEKGTQAILTFKVFEGPQVRVAAVAIEGNSFTKDRVIRREIDIHEGDILTPEKIDESVVRLNTLGIFSRVSIRTLEEGTTVANRNVIISVTERDPGTLRFGIGANSERVLTLTGSTGLSYNNLFGTARAVSTRIKLSSNVARTNYLEHEVTVGYLERFLFGTRIRGRANYTRSEIVQKFDEENDLTNILASDKIELLLERDISRYIKLTWKLWSLDSRTRFERNGYCLNELTLVRERCPGFKQNVAKIGPILDIDHRDNSFLPTTGYYSRLGVDYSHPGFGSSENVNFVRTEALYTYYLRMGGSPRWVWANSLRGGYVKNLGDRINDGVPASDAFILGGLNSVRGFEGTIDGDRIPRTDELPFDDATDLVIRTHSTFYLLKSELRFPIYNEFGGALFYDGGAVQIPDYDIPANQTGNQFRHRYNDAAGFGLRYNTQVGPVAFDFAWKLRPDPDRARFRVHFSIGTF